MSGRTDRASSVTRATRTASASSPPEFMPAAVCSRCRWCCRAACRSRRRPRLSSYADHRIPHALDLDEVRWLVREYGESAAIAIDAGVDAIEIHANHDDVVQWFLSPRTNRRDDEYGGTFEQRRRFLREIVESIRDHAPRADHARPAAVPRRDDRGRLRRRGMRCRPWPPSPPTAPSTTSASTSATTGATRATSRSPGTTTTSGRRCAGRRSRPPTSRSSTPAG